MFALNWGLSSVLLLRRKVEEEGGERSGGFTGCLLSAAFYGCRIIVTETLHCHHTVVTLGETNDSESEIHLESHSSQAGLSKRRSLIGGYCCLLLNVCYELTETTANTHQEIASCLCLKSTVSNTSVSGMSQHSISAK